VIVGSTPLTTDEDVNSNPDQGSTLDTVSPAVTLVGDAAMQIMVGDAFTDPGATALDPSTELGASGTDLTAGIVVTGNVDTATPGLYSLTYTATDAAGNSGTASRVVTVVAAAGELGA